MKYFKNNKKNKSEKWLSKYKMKTINTNRKMSCLLKILMKAKLRVEVIKAALPKIKINLNIINQDSSKWTI